MADPTPCLSLKDVNFRWSGRDGFHLNVPELSVAHAENVLLLGESGSGKSTLLSLICGTLLADQGRVCVAGTDLSALNSGQRDRFRAEEIGVIFQQFNLLPFGSVLDNILLPLRFAPKRRARVPDARRAAIDLCADLGLLVEVAQAKAARLSVGQQQRVAVARALIGQPPLIVADEPTSALDASSQSAFLDVLFRQTRAAGTTLLMVSHDARLANRFDRVVQMSDIAHVERRAA